MTTETQKLENAVSTLPQKAIICDMSGQHVAIIGAQLVSEATVKMCIEAVNMVHTAGPYTILFTREELTDDAGNKINAGFLHSVGCIALSLSNILEYASDQIINGTESEEHLPMNIRHIIQFALLRGLFHELHHSISWRTTGARIDWEASDTEEDDADTFAEVALCEFAKLHNVAPVVGLEPYFEEEIQNFRSILEEDPDNREEWESEQMELIDNNICWSHGEGKFSMTLKDYIRAYASDRDNPEWDTTIKEQTNVVETVPQATAPQTPEQTVVYEGSYNGDYEDEIPFDGPYEQDTYVQQPTQPIQQPTQQYVQPQAYTQQPATNTNEEAEYVNFMTLLMKRMHMHMFDKCGWTGNGFFDPQTVGAIAQPIMVGDIPGAHKFLTRYNGLNAQGRWQPNIPFQGMINGSLTKMGLPKYELFINFDGEEHQRLFIVQNPTKVNSKGQLSAPATEAKAGNKIAWLIDKNLPMGTEGGWKAKVCAAPGQVEASVIPYTKEQQVYNGQAG